MIIWRDTPTGYHRKDILKPSRMGHFTGDLPSQHGAFHGRWAESENGAFHGRSTNQGPNHRVRHFTAENQIAGWVISRERAKSQGGAFDGREPNYSVGHYTAESQITGQGISRQRAKSQGRPRQ